MSQADDELAIRQLAAAYTDACNCRSAEGMAGVYAPDGELMTAGRDRPIKGYDKLLLGFQRLLEQREFLLQTTHSGVVEVHGDTAVARWWFSEIKKPTGYQYYQQIFGCYQDELVRLDIGWRYSRRTAAGMFAWDIPVTQAHEGPPAFLPTPGLPGRAGEWAKAS